MSTATTPVAPTTSTARARRRRGLTSHLAAQPLLVLLVLMVLVIQTMTGAQLQWGNLRGVFLDSAVIAIVAAPVAMLTIAGYIDLSVGSTLALGGVLAGATAQATGSLPLAIAAAMAVGAAVGVVNGVLTTVAGLSSFVVTLGMLTAVRGVAQLVSPLPLSGFPDGFVFLGIGNIAAVPLPAIIALLVVLASGLFLTWTPAGRHVYAIGVNREAAFLSGIGTKRLPFVLYIVSGGSAGLAGAVVVARLNSAPSGQLGVGFELAVLTAVLLGGVALTGGAGSMTGVLVGVLFLGLLRNGLTLLGVTSFWQNVASGAALIAAIAVAALSQRAALRLKTRHALAARGGE